MWLQYRESSTADDFAFRHFQFASESRGGLQLVTVPCLLALQLIVLLKVSGFAVLLIFDARGEGILV